MKAIILSAGRGSRLLPLTQHRPKCLLPIGHLTMLERQIKVLHDCGVNNVCVVTGFGAEAVERTLAPWQSPNLSIRTIFNPFFQVSDNLASCWMAIDEMDSDFLLVNGDTLFEPRIPRRVLSSTLAPITITIDRKSSYDDDDMKVQLNGTRLLAVSKKLSREETDGESIGLLYFRGEGPQLFAQAIAEAMQDPEAVHAWYLMVVDKMARDGFVQAASIEGLTWGEVDTQEDLANVQRLFVSERDQASLTSSPPYAAE